MSTHETAADPATRALIDEAAAYDCTVTVDEKGMSTDIIGPAGTSKLFLSVSGDIELGFEVGEATWLSMYIGDDVTARAEAEGSNFSVRAAGTAVETLTDDVTRGADDNRSSGRVADYHRRLGIAPTPEHVPPVRHPSQVPTPASGPRGVWAGDLDW